MSFDEHRLASNLESIKKENICKREEIMDIERSSIELVRQLKDKIDSGEYDTLISDDVGGRIPTLILEKVFKKRGQDIQTFFISGGRRRRDNVMEIEDDYALGDFISKRKDSIKKALLVTEYMHSGGTIRDIALLFEKQGLTNFDVASLTINGISRVAGNFREGMSFEHQIFGSDGDCPSFHSESEDLTGVDRLDRRTGKHYSPNPHINQEAKRSDIIEIRRDIKILSEKIAKEVWG
jgi:hypothetical protein